MTLLIEERSEVVPLIQACDALAINRSTLYWRRGRRDLSDEQKKGQAIKKTLPAIQSSDC